MKYNTDTPHKLLEANNHYIDTRWEQLAELQLGLGHEGIKYLFLINSGASVAMLTFIGSAPSVKNECWAWLALGLFILGILFVGIIHFFRYHYIDWLYKSWRKDVLTYYEGKIDFDDIVKEDNYRSGRFKFAAILAYLSIFSFISGVIIGFVNN